MATGMRTYDSNTVRKANKQFHQLEKNIFEKNHFSSIGIVTNADVKGDGYWCEVKLIPIVNYKEFDMRSGYNMRDSNKIENQKIVALRSQSLLLANNDVVLLVFTDTNSRKAIEEIIKGKSKSDKFITEDQNKHDLTFGIVINKIL